MAFWACARVEPRREAVAERFLQRAGFLTYCPRLYERRLRQGKRIESVTPLFPGYTFLTIEQQWHVALRIIGVCGLIMGDERPARVPDAVIAGLKSRERADGLIELIKPVGLKRGDRVRISRGPFVGHLALFGGMKPRERCEVLLALLGAPQRVALARQDIEAVG